MTLGSAPGSIPIIEGQPISIPGSGQLAKLAAKLVRVMGAIGHIPKRGRNDFFGYDYATEADVADAVRTALVSEGVAMIPSIIDVKEREVLTRKNQKEIVTTVTLQVTFIDAESGGTFSFKMAGAGQDGGDKGIMKAISAGVKYAQLKALSLPTGDDPEADADTDGSQAARPSNGTPAAREPGSDDAEPQRYPLHGQPEPAPWPEDDPWAGEAPPGEPEPEPAPPPRRPPAARPAPPRARERTSAPRPAREPNRPDPKDCISEGKHRRLEAIMAAKARDYEWEPARLRAYVHQYLLKKFGIAHTTDIPWRGSTYTEICEWVEHLGAP